MKTELQKLWAKAGRERVKSATCEFLTWGQAVGRGDSEVSEFFEKLLVKNFSEAAHYFMLANPKLRG